MRIYYAGDVHGSEKCWRKFLGAAKFYEADTLVLGGDLTGKVMVPVVALGGGRHRARVLGRDEVVTDDELPELEKRVRFNGFYPYRCDPAEYERLERDEAHRDEVFRGLMRDEVRRWIALAEERLAGTGVRCFVMPGNDDEWDIDEALESTEIVNPDGRVVDLGEGVQLLSSAWTNPTPWRSPREEPEEALLARLEGIAAGLHAGAPAVFNLHCPPYDSGLDRAPQLTDDLRVVLDGGEPRIVSVGSRAVRELVERHQPLLALHGHIHESKGITRIGKTTCVNPGSAYGEGVLDGAVVDIRDRKIRRKLSARKRLSPRARVEPDRTEAHGAWSSRSRETRAAPALLPLCSYRSTARRRASVASPARPESASVSARCVSASPWRSMQSVPAARSTASWASASALPWSPRRATALALTPRQRTAASTSSASLVSSIASASASASVRRPCR
jgi:uncharacterized protein